MQNDLPLLAVHAATNFVFTGSGRIACENDPESATAPRVYVAGCAGGNLARVRHDVGDATARAISDLVEREPPWTNPGAPPLCLREIQDLLSRESPGGKAEAGPIYELPFGVVYPRETSIVRSDSAEGDRLAARLTEEGMPPSLLDAGFRSLGDFWPPWCVALEGGDIASIAFAARLSPAGAEIGVHTFPPYRGRGLAAAATAAWAATPSLAGRALFYSTTEANRSSLRVAERLSLRRMGAAARIY